MFSNSSRTKYGNTKTTYRGNNFHSKKEAEYAKFLDISRRAKNPRDRVVEWIGQLPYPIVVCGEKIARYYADFYVKYADGRVEIVDVKGFRTNEYIIKKKLVEAIYKIKIIEV